MPEQLPHLKSGLTEAGFGLSETISVASLDIALQQRLPAIGFLPSTRQTLLLVANSGQHFWDVLRTINPPGFLESTTDPVDSFSCRQITQVIRQVLPTTDFHVLYPEQQSVDSEQAPLSVSLQALGHRAGWHQASPLGIGIHPEQGLWYAYRGLVLLDLPAVEWAPEMSEAADRGIEDICTTCQSQACIAACPAKALALGVDPNMDQCSYYRLAVGSQCQDKCLARNACPVGVSSRYPPEQTAYHYEFSLAAIKHQIRS